MGQTLNGPFLFTRIRSVLAHLGSKNMGRTIKPCKHGSLSQNMGTKALLHIIRDATVNLAVGTLQQINKP